MKKLWKYTKTLITVGVIAFFIYYFINNKADFFIVLSTPFIISFFIALLYSLTFVLNGVFIQIILKKFNKSISILESFYVSTISSLGNYFLPMRGGAVIRSVYLKKRFRFPYSLFVSTLYGYYVVVFLVNSFFALLSLLFITFKYGVVSIPLYLFFISTFVFMLLLSFISFPINKIKDTKATIINWFIKTIKNILKGWNIIVQDKKLLLSLFYITILVFLINIFLFSLEFLALGIEISFINVVLYNCLSGVSLLASITPGSLGIREGIFIINSEILGINNEQVMQLALLDRGIMVVTLIILFLFFYIYKKFDPEKKLDI